VAQALLTNIDFKRRESQNYRPEISFFYISKLVNSIGSKIENNLKSQRLWGVFLLGFFLLNYPFLMLYNKDLMILDIPILYFYIFLFLFGMILLTRFVIKKSKNDIDA